MQMRGSVCERRSMAGLGVLYLWTKAFVFRSSKSAYPQVYWLGPLAFLKHFSSCVVITAWPDDEKSDCRYGIRTNPSTG